MLKKLNALKYLLLVFVLGTCFLFPGCSGAGGAGGAESILGLGVLLWQIGVFDKGSGDDGNDPPEILTLTAAPNTIPLGGSVLLTVIAYDPDSGDHLTYSWTSGDGTLTSPNESVTTWVAPTNTTGTYYININVSDSEDSVTSQVPVVVTLT